MRSSALGIGILMVTGFSLSVTSIFVMKSSSFGRALTSQELSSLIGGDDCDECRKTVTDPSSPKNCQQCRPKPFEASEKYSKGPFGKTCALESPDPTPACHENGGEIVCGTGVAPENPLGRMLYYEHNEDCLGEPQAQPAIGHIVKTATGSEPCP